MGHGPQLPSATPAATLGLVLALLPAAACSAPAPRRAEFPSVVELVASPAPVAAAAPKAAAARRDYEDYIDDSGWAKQGVYIGGSVGQTYDIDGDFDGNTGLVDEDGNFIVLPELDDDPGFGVRLGYRFHHRALELCLSRYIVDGDFQNVGIETELTYLDLNFKEYFLVDTPVQPFVLLGLSSIWGELEDAAVNASLTAVRNAELIGHAGNVGAGIAFLPLPSLHLEAAAVYRVAEITEARGFGNANLIDGDVDISGWSLDLAVTFTL